MTSCHAPAAANVGHGDDAAEVTHEDGATDAEGRRDGDVEAAVTVEKHRVRAVPDDALKHVKTCIAVIACTSKDTVKSLA